MSIFEKIRNAIFSRARNRPAPKAGTTPAKPAAPTATRTASAPAAAPAAAAPSAAPVQEVDVEEILNDLAAKNPQKLNWQTSIVDLMKLLSLNSSLKNRTELAQELGYKGSTTDSASMNIWLHKQVMTKLAENGGRVPAALRE